MKTLQKLLYAAWGKDKVQLMSAYPNKTDAQNISPPIITYSILSKTPGAFKNSAEIKPRYRETIIVNEIVKGEEREIPIELYGQTFDYKILFELWSENGDSADELVEKFQLFMSQYTGYMKKVGVIEVLFDRMEGSNGSGEWKTDLIKRDMIYHIRLDEVTSIRCSLIEEVVISMLMHDSSYNMLLNLSLLEADPSREALYGDPTETNTDDDS